MAEIFGLIPYGVSAFAWGQPGNHKEAIDTKMAVGAVLYFKMISAV